MPLNPSNSLLLSAADSAFASTGIMGQLILLSSSVYSGTVTANASTNIITTAAAHGMIAGAKVRIGSTGTVPTPLVVATDYYANVTSATTTKLFLTLSDAQAGTNEIDLTDAGSGTITLTEQQPDEKSPIALLMSKELAGPGYARQPLASLGASTINATGQGAKPDKTVTLTNSGASTLSFRHMVVALGANSTIGSGTGITGILLQSEATDQTIAAGQSRQFLIKLFVEKP